MGLLHNLAVAIASYLGCSYKFIQPVNVSLPACWIVHKCSIPIYFNGYTISLICN